MKTKNYILATMLFANIMGAVAQENTSQCEQVEQIERLSKEISSVKSNQAKSEKQIKALNDMLVKQSVLLDSLNNRITSNSLSIQDVKTEAKKDIAETKTSLKKTSELMSSDINTKSLYAGIIGLLAGILAIVLYCIHRIFNKRNASAVSGLEDELKRLTQEQDSLESAIVNSNSKIIDVIEKQLSIINQSNSQISTINNDVDHSLAISVANELTRIQQNLNHMDEKVKGVSQLKNRAKAILTTLNSKQYEIPELLGKEYHEGDNIIATMELNEEMELGKNRIKRVIKPQVSYKGKLIQAAEVVVEYNE